ncbi:MAG: fumarylacetoacetate hydrolase family protein [Burkholderiales bacterium]|nr:fumarylacetoacetate hydrolase family protein [Burkholderiales bacterium]
MIAPGPDTRIARGMTAQLARRSSRLIAGDVSLGWKVGFGAPAAMAQLGIRAPLVGFLCAGARLAPGAAVDVSRWKQPAAEAEIAVWMGADLPGGAGRDAVKRAIEGIGPAIELADVAFPPADVEAILKGNIYQRHVLLGPCDRARAGCVLDGLSAVVARNGTEIARLSDTQPATGELVDIVRHVADTLAAFGERLRAGEVVITGSITPPLWVAAGEDLLFRLEPVGEVSVRFA